MTFMEPETELRNFFRNNLTDYNSSSRSGEQWIYDDEPRANLTKNSYPRISVKKITASQKLIGMADNTMRGTVSLQVDVLVHRENGVFSITETDEAVGTIANSPRINLNYLAYTVTNIKHNTTAYGTTTAVTNDNSFTTPASLAAGTVEWSRSSGNLNFSSSDLASHSGQSITSTYVRTLEGETLAMRLGRDAVKAIRSSWRTDALIGELIIPEILDDVRLLPFDEVRGAHHAIFEVQFVRYNMGEEV